MAASTYKLTYFNSKGLSEGIRFIFAYADVKFEDFRFERPDWAALKEKQPYGTVPVLEVDGKQLTQSVAICRFLGKRFGLVASDPFTEALLEALVDNIRDALTKLMQAFHNKTPETEKASKEALTFVLSKIENLATEGYFYGSKATWVDIYFSGFVESMRDHEPAFLDPYPNLKALVDRIKNKDSVQKYIKQRPAPMPHAH
ncbi:glutathione S-transferase 1-like [Arctopsyche grandis]|uniref:glutathione S-transferase 1-like n=1 Tax=Arctopsyche grandis TaxID=121162 RepID=UPI00406D9852